MLPLWLYTLGSVLLVEAEIQIPVILLLANLLIVVVPCLIGFAISCKYSKLRKIAMKVAKPVTLVFIVTFLTLVTATKFYTFRLMKWQFFLAGIIF